MTQGNVFYRNGIGSSVATRWNIIDNLFFEGGIFWNNLDLNPIRDGYMLLRRNAFINPPQSGYLAGYRLRTGASTPGRRCSATASSTATASGRPRTPCSSTTAGRRSTRPSRKSARSSSGNSTAKSNPTTRKRTPFESVVKAMGGSVVTFRIPWGKHSGEARPMLADAAVNGHWPGAVLSTDIGSVPCYFWRVADGNYEVAPWPTATPASPITITG